MFVRFSRALIHLLLVVSLLTLSACVTTTESAFTRKANVNDAIQKYVELGLEYIKRDDYQRARKHLDRALELDPDNAAALAARGLIFHREGEPQLAEKAYVEALDSDPSYTRGLTYYGAFLFSEQRYEHAKAQFELAAEDVNYPSRSQIYSNIALCNTKLGLTQEAIDAYTKALRLERMNGRALAGITELLLEQGDYARASAYYNRLITLVAQQGLKHSPQSLWQGVRIAKFYNSKEQLDAFGTLLAQLYPDSEEYQRYLQLMK